MTPMKRTFARFGAMRFATLLLLAIAPAVAGCSTNPATGRPTFTAFMSEADELQVGREQHPQIVAEFGGIRHVPPA